MGKFFDHMINTLLGVASVWFAAMLFNPDIDSGTVWVLGLVYGWLYADNVELLRER